LTQFRKFGYTSNTEWILPITATLAVAHSPSRRRLPVFISMRIRVWFMAACALAAPPAVHADYVSQLVILDQSNTLKDGVAYGSVLVEAYNGVGAAGGGLKAGEVRLTFTADPTAYDSVSKTFGIDHLGFNTDLTLTAGQITQPSGWKISSAKTLSGFGKFTWDADGSAKGGSRLNPASVLIDGLGSNATIDHFLIGSVGSGKNPPSEGSVYFAMHVAGFSVKGNDATSHWVGGSTRLIVDPPPPPGPEGSGDVRPTPEPASIILGAFGIGAVWLGRMWRSRK
jgi:hypothetical protein